MVEQSEPTARFEQRPDVEPSLLPTLHFRTTGLPDAEAFAHWRELMAPLFHIEQARYTSAVPRGNLSMFVIGEIIANRCTFNAQHLSRDPALIAATPNHLVLQYYKSGGFRGAIARRPVCIVRGQVAITDLSQEIDAYAATSDTIGLSVPRSLLGDIDPMALRLQLDAPRNRLLGSYMSQLPKRLARASVTDVASLSAELITLLGRVFAPGALEIGTAPASDHETLLDRALALIEVHLGLPDLSPSFVAARTGTSRATLFRLFGPMGGIMRYVQERRLLAVRDSLSDSLDKRTLGELVAVHGFTSQAVLSRAFRTRFGASPRDWRQQHVERDLATREPFPEPAHVHWQELGQDLGRPTRKAR